MAFNGFVRINHPRDPVTIEDRSILKGVVVTLTNDVVDADPALCWSPTHNQIVLMRGKPQCTQSVELKYLNETWEAALHKNQNYNSTYVDSHGQPLYVCFEFDTNFKRLPGHHDYHPGAKSICYSDAGEDQGELRTSTLSDADVLYRYMSMCHRDLSGCREPENTEYSVIRLDWRNHPMIVFTRECAGLDYVVPFNFSISEHNAKRPHTTQTMLTNALNSTAFQYMHFFNSAAKTMQTKYRTQIRKAQGLPIRRTGLRNNGNAE